MTLFPIAYHTSYKYPVPAEHRFPMEKYELLPLQLLHEGIVQVADFFTPDLVSMDAVYAVHEKDYIDAFISNTLDAAAARRIGFEQTPLLVERELRLAQGTLQGALKSLENNGIAFNIAGGTHHACRGHGEGFCMINDQAVAARYLTNQCGLKKVLIIDLDVHQGNGSADIFSDDDRVFTCSVHGKNNYPFRKEKSDLDIGLDDGTDDVTYLKILTDFLPGLLEDVQPEFIFYQAGVDILASDKMGRMACTIEGCKRRDEIVLQTARKLNLPVQVSMGGGYSPQIKTILEAHCNTYRVASQLW